MQLSTYLFGNSLRVPGNFADVRTIDLLADGLVMHLIYRGVPVFTPVGWRVLSAIERLLEQAAERAGFCAMKVPSLMRDEDLAGGEPLGPIFAKKLMSLGGAFEGYHLLSTPEMLIAKMSQAYCLSYRSLPVRFCYAADFFRDMPTTRSVVTSRQFRVFGTISIEKDREAVEHSLRQATVMTQQVCGRLGVPLSIETRDSKCELTFHYASARAQAEAEGGNGEGPGTRLALAMGYHYGDGMRLPIVYRTKDNKNARGLLATYGLSLQRLIFALFDASRDNLGFSLPKDVRPFDLTIIPRREQDMEHALKVYDAALHGGQRAALDDRFAKPHGDRLAASDYLGTPLVLTVAASTCRRSRRGQHEDPECVALEQALAGV